VEVSSPMDEIKDVFLKEGYSRIPVYKEDGRKRPYVNWEEVEKLMEPILEFIYSKLSLVKL
jgi:hypothetical protein